MNSAAAGSISLAVLFVFLPVTNSLDPKEEGLSDVRTKNESINNAESHNSSAKVSNPDTTAEVILTTSPTPPGLNKQDPVKKPVSKKDLDFDTNLEGNSQAFRDEDGSQGKNLKDAGSISFVVVFSAGLIFVVGMFLWKKAKMSRWRSPASFQYSELNSNTFEEDLSQPLRSNGEPSLLLGHDSSDDDLLNPGEEVSLGQGQGDTSLFLGHQPFGSFNSQEPTNVPTSSICKLGVSSQFPEGRIHSSLLDDSDEELLQ